MSGTAFVALDPDMPVAGTQDGRDNDTFGVDATANMQKRGTTISSIGTPVVAREDGQTMGASDLVISSVVVATGGLKWTYKATKGQNAQPGTRYIATFPLTLASADVIYRSVVHVVPGR